MKWCKAAESFPRKKGEYLAFYKAYANDEFRTGILPFIPGKVGDVEADDPAFVAMMESENVFYHVEYGENDEWWYEPVCEVSHWMPKPVEPEYCVDIVNNGSYSGDFIKQWVNFHRHVFSPYTDAARKLWNAIWSKEAQSAGTYPLNRNLIYKVIESGERVFAKKVTAVAAS